MFLRSCVFSIVSNRFISRCSLNLRFILSASQDVYVLFLRLLLPCANARSPRDFHSIALPALSSRGIRVAACIADGPTNLLKTTQTPPMSRCPVRRATIEQRHLSRPWLPAHRLTAHSRQSKLRQSPMLRRLFHRLLRSARKEARFGTCSVKDPGPTTAKRPDPARTTKSRACWAESLLCEKLQ